MRIVLRFGLVVFALLLASAVGWAQMKTLSQGDMATVTATIEAIDHAGRLVTLKDQADGHVETIYAGPEVKRFDALKVGDKVTFRYHESVVLQLRKAGGSRKRRNEQVKRAELRGCPSIRCAAGGESPPPSVTRSGARLPEFVVWSRYR